MPRLRVPLPSASCSAQEESGHTGRTAQRGAELGPRAVAVGGTPGEQQRSFSVGPRDDLVTLKASF